jgi:protein Mpv17
MSSIALARAYQQSFEAYPHCTLAIAGAALTALGDTVAQLSQYIVRFIFGLRPFTLIFLKITSSNDHRAGFHYDIPRTLRFFCFGAGISTCFYSAR